ncbi:MAG: respiratory nitrate reductase subunit gamma [Syntrophorhabdaceae bacterium]|nr:respiratory nitrate reductase subunit gamma [Syntrophorhabdaceae bacterium]
MNSMNAFIAILTYFAYTFIIVAYTVKIIKYLKLPVHLRWELYPVIHEEAYQYGGSCFEKSNWWDMARKRRNLKGILWLLRGYFTLDEYFKKNLFYWLGLYPWHIGFIFIITFHILCFMGALFMVSGISISHDSPDVIGRFFYYAILLTGVISFISGAIGGIIILINRVIDKNLKTYASPLQFFMYLFTLAVFLSGLYSWHYTDPDLQEYRQFWVGLITFNFIGVETATMVHIIFFDLFLIYLPFTRSLHYITRFFAFFLIRWEDTPNIRGGELEKKLLKQLDNKITWSGPHIMSGKPWKEQ